MNLFRLILTCILVLIVKSASAQTLMEDQYVSINIQDKLVDRKWSSHPNTDQKIVFIYSSDGVLSLFTAGNKAGSESYYITQEDCSNSRANFTSTKVGQQSPGNFIKTKGFCYEIELYPTLERFRIKKTEEPESKWRDFFLVD